MLEFFKAYRRRTLTPIAKAKRDEEMKIVMTVEFEVSDIPENERLEIVRDTGMDNEDMPRISEMTDDEVRSEISDAFDAMFNGATYDMQSEMWAGSDFYGYITGFRVIPHPSTN